MESAASLASPEKLLAIQSGLLKWFAENRRDLPWRLTRDPYAILVSEVMLQQTQVDRVIPYFERFLERFPTVRDLAAAPPADVITIWAGLGYNRRAVNLQRTARAVVQDHGGCFPSDPETLTTLPGVGPYTAGAIACFAFEQDVAFLDTNMRRVVHRLFAGPDLPKPRLSEKLLSALASALVPHGEGWTWNQALIEFGALQCTARRPACVVCPLQRVCVAFPEIQTTIALLPVGARKKQEAPFAGSNRFYRGRLLAALRQQSACSPESPGLELLELGPRVRDDFAPEHVEWLYDVAVGLQRDGLAAVAEQPATYDAERRALVSLP